MALDISGTRPPRYGGRPIDTSDRRFGELRASSMDSETADELRRRMADEGYLYLPGALDSEEVLACRRLIVEKLTAEGALDPAYPPMEAVPAPGSSTTSDRADLADRDPNIRRLLFDGLALRLFEELFDEPVLHFDRVWLRTKGRDTAVGTAPHCDVVFMGRGTDRLLTMWIPYGDTPTELGGLMVLEESIHRSDVLNPYWDLDVDRYCTNLPEAHEIESGRKLWEDAKNRGVYSEDPRAVQTELGGRWLTTDYTAGDVVVFPIRTMHAALDNQTDRLRISSDTRYQPASEPADDRWIGPEYAGHGPAAKIGDIC